MRFKDREKRNYIGPKRKLQKLATQIQMRITFE